MVALAVPEMLLVVLVEAVMEKEAPEAEVEADTPEEMAVDKQAVEALSMLALIKSTKAESTKDMVA